MSLIHAFFFGEETLKVPSTSQVQNFALTPHIFYYTMGWTPAPLGSVVGASHHPMMTWRTMTRTGSVTTCTRNAENMSITFSSPHTCLFIQTPGSEKTRMLGSSRRPSTSGESSQGEGSYHNFSIFSLCVQFFTVFLS